MTEMTTDTSAASLIASWKDVKLATAFQQHRKAFAYALLDSIRSSHKYQKEIEAYGDDLEEFLEREIYSFVDYLILLFRTGNTDYLHLYVGEKLKQLYEPGVSIDIRRERSDAILRQDRERLLKLLVPEVEAEEIAIFERLHEEIARIVIAEAPATAKILLVGDCLYLDIMSFLSGRCLEDGISIDPTYVASKNPLEVRRELRSLSARKFDLVFFSPFTYEFSAEYTNLMNWQSAVTRPSRLARIAAEGVAETERALEILVDQFECPILVHNSANIRRHNSSWREWIKNLATRPARRIAADYVNRGLDSLLAKRSAEFENVRLLDERPLLRLHGEYALGKFYHQAGLQHPASFGRHLAEEYHAAIVAQMQLASKKLVVCDLDNTLWNGIIGEGSVRHHHYRQEILQRLRKKGVLLAINSKNDPKNVHFTGGVLQNEDFVSSAINWEPKTNNMRQIQHDLNLKTKDFIFIDDRRDEREMMQMAFPEIRSLNAEDSRTWQLFDAWARLLPEQKGPDRTESYRQREQREKFLEEDSVQDHLEMLKKLNLQVTIRFALKEDYKRIVELINRTNQFNMCGSRVSQRDFNTRCEKGEWQVLVTDAADRFGPMGTVSVLVFSRNENVMEILIFVLSCRVFGYGIEDAILNRCKDLAVESLTDSTSPRIVGHYQETPHNEPCRQVYPRNEFIKEDGMWIHTSRKRNADPEWLAVTFAK